MLKTRGNAVRREDTPGSGGGGGGGLRRQYGGVAGYREMGQKVLTYTPFLSAFVHGSLLDSILVPGNQFPVSSS